MKNKIKDTLNNLDQKTKLIMELHFVSYYAYYQSHF